MFFKRRSRANSYIDTDSPPQRTVSQSDDHDKYDRYTSVDGRPGSSQLPSSAQRANDSQDMFPRQHAPQDSYGSTRVLSNGAGGHNALPLDSAALSSSAAVLGGGKHEPTPDLLQRAFNEALRPYTDKISELESQVADLRTWIEQMEQERQDVYNWIDKRGLRPDVPPVIAKAMDSTSPSSAATLNAQLDRKITIVNFDLHRLQDDLNDSISTSHFAAAMLKFLPDISRLSSLPTGPRMAFDLLLKLGGNLNSHGGLDSGDPSDLAARRDFYNRLDGAMVEVVQRRFAEGEEWGVSREIKRIEKTAAYLRNFGVEPYFPATLDLMRRDEGFVGGSAGGDARNSANIAQLNGSQNTPPRYQ